MAHNTMTCPGLSTQRGSARAGRGLHFLRVGLLSVGLCLAFAGGQTAHAQGERPSFHDNGVEKTTGNPVPGGEGIDQAVLDILVSKKIAGGQLTIVKDGRPLYERGFGWAEFESKRAVEPTDRFRVGQVSHLLTSATAMILADQDRIDLEANPLAVMRIEPFTMQPNGQREYVQPDPRLADLTFADLMRHQSGWSFAPGEDPILDSWTVAVTLRNSDPDPRMIVELIAGTKLEAEPGTRTAPTMFNSVLLGEAMEATIGQPAEDLTKRFFLSRARVRGAEVGTTEDDDEVTGEVTYYDSTGARTLEYENRIAAGIANQRVEDDPNERRHTSTAGGVPEPAPYAAWDVELLGAGGGWVMSATELAAAVSALEQGRRPLLDEDARAWMLDRPESAGSAKTWTSAGWQRVEEREDGLHASSIGTLSGTIAMVVRRPDGVVWAMTFNTGSGDPRRDGVDAVMKSVDDAITKAFANAPTNDRRGRRRP